MKTEALIRGLASQAGAVRPMPHPARRFAVWLVLAGFWVVVLATAIGMRADAAEMLSDPGVWVEVGLMVAVALSAAAAAFVLGIPGEKKGFAVVVPCLVVGVLATLGASWWELDHAAHAGVGWRCLRNVLLLSVVPGWILGWMLRRGFVMHVGRTTALAVLSAASMACAATRFLCPSDDPLHFLAWHFGPIVLLGLLAAFCGGRALDRLVSSVGVSHPWLST